MVASRNRDQEDQLLRESQSPSLRGSGRFLAARRGGKEDHHVSIPFIAGQWSLRGARWSALTSACTSQSPSLRGSGRFKRRRITEPDLVKSQSPSLRGSGRFEVARRITEPDLVKSQSPSLRGSGRFGTLVYTAPNGVRSQSPSLRGSGRFPRRSRRRRPPPHVSIPFIAGQWSLHEHTLVRALKRALVSIPFIAGQWSLPAAARAAAALAAGLNPLHCGAVVASGKEDHCDGNLLYVSIPFIAGQWSLLSRLAPRRKSAHDVSIPFIAGQWSLRSAPSGLGTNSRVSIPFIAGQWSLPFRDDFAETYNVSFNPLHCGAVVAS